jgi:hypothetical protein
MITIELDEESISGTYPFLGVKGDMIVLFKADGVGIVLASDDQVSVGHYSTTWDMSKFAPWRGRITLSNSRTVIYNS